MFTLFEKSKFIFRVSLNIEDTKEMFVVYMSSHRNAYNIGRECFIIIKFANVSNAQRINPMPPIYQIKPDSKTINDVFLNISIVFKAKSIIFG